MIRSIGCIWYPEFEWVGIVKLVRLLNSLGVEALEIVWGSRGTLFLLNVCACLPVTDKVSFHGYAA